VLRQGGFVTLGHPARAARALRPMFDALASDRKAREINDAILDRPNAPLYARAKLYLAPLDGSLTKREEGFMSRLAGKLPHVAASQRAYVTFLNVLRADSFDAMVETLTANGEATAKEAEAIANYLNVVTGRSSIPDGAVGAALSTALFSPRYLASRFQIIAGQPFYRGTGRTRQLVAAEYGRYLAGLAVVYLLGSLAGGEIEKDPRSSDFGKIKLGDTRIDPLSGLAQVTVFTSRVFSGETKTQRGRIRPLRGPDVKFGQQDMGDVLERFARSKLSPTFGAAVDVVAGKDVIGKPVAPAERVASLAVPLSLRDIYGVMEEHGVAKGTAIEILNLFGMGVQHYGDD
jgi:hypothetical protein